MKYIKKIKKTTIESKLNKKLKPNIIAIGFDSSEHATGIAIISSKNDYIVIEYTGKITVPKKIQELDAVDLFTEQLDDLKSKLIKDYLFDINIIENCYVGFNPKAAMWLARIGILIYDRFKRVCKKSYLLFPKSARATVGFKTSKPKLKRPELKQELVDFVNKTFEIKIDDNDIADAIILALAGLIGIKGE